jgi:hypothetical protein
MPRTTEDGKLNTAGVKRAHYIIKSLNNAKVLVSFFLGCSYRASSVRIAIMLPTDATVYFVYLFPLFLPYIFRALISPSSGVSQAFFIYNHLVHAVFMLLICVCLWTGLLWWFHCIGVVVVLL